jgi:hypothetical protein
LKITTRQHAKCQKYSGLASKNTNPVASLASFFFPLIDLSYILASYFSVLVSENTGLLASLVSVLQNLSTPLTWGKKD